jgi:hypothetical protein
LDITDIITLFNRRYLSIVQNWHNRAGENLADFDLRLLMPRRALFGVCDYFPNLGKISTQALPTSQRKLRQHLSANFANISAQTSPTFQRKFANISTQTSATSQRKLCQHFNASFGNISTQTIYQMGIAKCSCTSYTIHMCLV